MQRTLDYNAPVRQVWRWLSALPRALLVQPEQLGTDVAYALALIPPLALGLLFFRRPAALLLAFCLLAGTIGLLAFRLAGLTIGLPAWVGHRANHPLVAALLIVAVLSPVTPPWLGVSLVVLFILLDSLAWPHLRRMAVHPALLCVGILSVAQQQLGFSFLSPFDGRPLDDPLRLHTVIDPVTLYVGNVPGPLGTTSAAAVLLGIAYLWYTRKVSLGMVAGFVIGVAAAAAAFRLDVAFQVSGGAALFLAGYLAADRRRLAFDERLCAGLGLCAGALTIFLRTRGQGAAAAWEALLAVTAALSLAIQGRMVIESRQRSGGLWRRTTVRSGRAPAVRPAPAVSPGRPGAMPPAPPLLLTQPAQARSAYRNVPASRSTEPPSRSAEPASRVEVLAARQGLATRTMSRQAGTSARPAPNDDIVRQMRSAALRGSPEEPRLVRIAALVLLNPVGLWLTWRDPSQSTYWKAAVTALSVLWYAAVAGAVLLVGHQAIRL